jgi:hypothetical protein
MTPKIHSGTVTVGNTQQSVVYTELLRLVLEAQAPHRLRITIRANAYVDQSHGEIERWDGDRWQQVFYLNGGEMQTPVKGMYVADVYRSPIRAPYFERSVRGLLAFEADREYLITRAIEVLS